jgi:hypothetical protein
MKNFLNRFDALDRESAQLVAALSILVTGVVASLLNAFGTLV